LPRVVLSNTNKNKSLVSQHIVPELVEVEKKALGIVHGTWIYLMTPAAVTPIEVY